jgi:hypothetical protein
VSTRKFTPDASTASGDPFVAAARHDKDEPPHLCVDGWVFVGRVVESEHDLDGEVVEYDRVPCRRCAQEE